MTTIQCFEHEILRVGAQEASQPFTYEQWESLVRWQEKQKQPFFSVVHRGIKFSQWVGVLRVGSLTIEILPKAEAERDSCTIDRSQLVERWKARLLRMLKESHHLDIRSVDEASLRLQNHTILDLIFERFLDHAEALIAQGLIKRYRLVARNRTAVKGRIDYPADTSTNYAHHERVYTVASEYDQDNIWNRIMYHAASLVADFARGAAVRARAQALLICLPNWGDTNIDPECFEQLPYDRKSEVYRTMNRFAELIISRLNPQIQSGGRPVFALLFDMNRLWEGWIYARLRRAYRERPEVVISCQKSKIFWRVADVAYKTVRPDIIIEIPGKPTVVVDAKWKVLTTPIPSDDDLKQMYVYNELWDCPTSHLVYPEVHGLLDSEGFFTCSGTQLRVAFIDMDLPLEQWYGLFDRTESLVDG